MRSETHPDARADGTVTIRWESVIFCPFCGRNHNCPDTYPDENEPTPYDCECGKTFWYTWEAVPYFHCHPSNPEVRG